MNNPKKIIIFAFIIPIILITVGYSNFTSNLNVNGTAEIIGEWNVKITNVEVINVSPGSDAGNPQFTDSMVTFNTILGKPGDSVVYEVTIKNLGTIDAKLNDVVFMEDTQGTDAISFKTTELAKELASGEMTTFTVKVTYNNVVTNPSYVKTKTLTGIIQYSQV